MMSLLEELDKLYPEAAIPLELKKTKLRGLSPRANYTDQATSACRRS
jgi:hypothetical protein